MIPEGSGADVLIGRYGVPHKLIFGASRQGSRENVLKAEGPPATNTSALLWQWGGRETPAEASQRGFEVQHEPPSSLLPPTSPSRPFTGITVAELRRITTAQPCGRRTGSQPRRGQTSPGSLSPTAEKAEETEIPFSWEPRVLTPSTPQRLEVPGRSASAVVLSRARTAGATFPQRDLGLRTSSGPRRPASELSRRRGPSSAIHVTRYEEVDPLQGAPSDDEDITNIGTLRPPGHQSRQKRPSISETTGMGQSGNHKIRRNGNPFVEYEDREQKLQWERRWLLDDASYLKARTRNLQHHTSMERVKLKEADAVIQSMSKVVETCDTPTESLPRVGAKHQKHHKANTLPSKHSATRGTHGAYGAHGTHLRDLACVKSLKSLQKELKESIIGGPEPLFTSTFTLPAGLLTTSNTKEIRSLPGATHQASTPSDPSQWLWWMRNAFIEGSYLPLRGMPT